jgi:hypothetical protein
VVPAFAQNAALEPLKAQFPRLQIVWADQGHKGDLRDWMKSQLDWRLEIGKRTTAKQQK